jgi:methionine synthase II (cobalamin-independent)
MKVTVTGRFSILRAGEHPLRTAIDAWRARGDTTPEAALRDPDLLAAQAAATRDLVAAQEAAGVGLPSDGYVPIYDEWFAAAPAAGVPVGAMIRYLDTNTYYHRWLLSQRPRRRAESPAVAAYRRAQALTRTPLKPCLFGPYTLWAYAVKEGAGATPAAFDALVDLWAEDVAALAAVGARTVQLDESVLLRPAHRGDFALVSKAIHRIAAAAPSVTLILHLACGHAGDLFPRLLEIEGLGGLGLDFTDAHRAPNLRALAGWHGEKILQAGLANARQIRVEPPAELRETLAAIGAHVPRARCLLAPSAGLHYLPRHAAFEKLAALVAVAKEVAS